MAPPRPYTVAAVPNTWVVSGAITGVSSRSSVLALSCFLRPQAPSDDSNKG